MTTKSWFALSLVCLAASPMLRGQATKNGSVATGSVVGAVTCADTNAPARFAVVTLERVPEAAAVAGPELRGSEETTANPTATTDLEGRFVMEKVPAGRYYVLGSLTGYLNPLAQFSQKQMKEMDEETRKALAAEMSVVTVAPNQRATANLRLEHAATVEGTVLYDDGSPAEGCGFN